MFTQKSSCHTFQIKTEGQRGCVKLPNVPDVMLLTTWWTIPEGPGQHTAMARKGSRMTGAVNQEQTEIKEKHWSICHIRAPGAAEHPRPSPSSGLDSFARVILMPSYLNCEPLKGSDVVASFFISSVPAYMPCIQKVLGARLLVSLMIMGGRCDKQ